MKARMAHARALARYLRYALSPLAAAGFGVQLSN
jgi:hypothetical protein